jgi:hypothetical protein
VNDSEWQISLSLLSDLVLPYFSIDGASGWLATSTLKLWIASQLWAVSYRLTSRPKNHRTELALKKADVRRNLPISQRSFKVRM